MGCSGGGTNRSPLLGNVKGIKSIGWSVQLFFFILLASCAPVNNVANDKNEKTDIVVSTEIVVESSTEQQNVNLEEKKLEKKPSFIIPDESLQNNITIILSKKTGLKL